MEIGFIGLGNMGGAIAGRLARTGHDLIVYDIDPAAVTKLTGLGATAAGSARDVASRTAVVMVCLPTPDVVVDVLTGEDGVITGSAVRTAVDLSTSGPAASETVNGRLTAAGIGFLDSPISGGIAGAEAGTLVVMAAGAPEVLETVRAPLDDISKQVVHIGTEPGLGQAMKLTNNMLAAACAIASFEVMTVGVKAGLDPAVMVEVIQGSTGNNHAMHTTVPRSVLTREFPQRFTTELFHKDVTLGLREAERLGVPLSVIPVVRQFLQFGITQGDGPRDYAHLIKHLERWSGVEVGAKEEHDG